jgi:hypothetical protein
VPPDPDGERLGLDQGCRHAAHQDAAGATA